jgi:hypothetical protein
MSCSRLVLLTCGVLVSLAGFSLLWAADSSGRQDIAELEKTLAALRNDRVETAALALAANQAAFEAGSLKLDVLLETARRLAEARLAAAGDATERIKACEEYLALARLNETMMDARLKEGFGGVTVADAADAKYLRQSVEIMLTEERLTAARK